MTVSEGTYPIIRKKFSGLEVQHTDGIGTKGHYHWQAQTFKNAVLDALAMNLNDLAMVGAVPYAIQNHIVIPVDDHSAILEIVRALAHECQKRGIAMTGGETSVQDSSVLDISVTMSGFIKKKFKNQFKVGDVLIGFKSNGVHANGFTRVRSMFGAGEWRDDFVEPTAIYLDSILAILKKYDIHGMMHITGGAFSKLKDLLPHTDALIMHPPRLVPQNIFYELHERGIASEDMYRTFNCGIGFIIGVDKKDAPKILRMVKNAAEIGSVVKGNGSVHISSAFDGKEIKL